MTTVNILERRKRTLEQRKNRLKQFEASLNAQTRKSRTRKLIEIGGLAAKATIENWNTNTLYGAFLFLKEKESESNGKLIKEWTRKGGAAFAADKEKSVSSSARKKGEPVIVKFETQPPAEIKTSLKTLGLKWNALRQEWEGYAKIEELKELIEPHKASILELSTPDSEDTKNTR